jgi:hypothetical protein
MDIINRFTRTAVLPLVALLLYACEKPAGPGGRATIKGRIHATDFDNTQRYKISEGYEAGERVYICYGNSTSISDDVRTGLDGTFEFKYLTKGQYKIFVNSLDTSEKFKGNDTEHPVIKEIKITEPKQVVDVGVIHINK